MSQPMTQAPSIKEALEHYAHEYCEGWCEQDAGCANFDDCGGCLARRALATLQPSGERREAIARAMFEVDALPHFTWDEVGQDRHDRYYRMADAAILASGLVQDEAAIRADQTIGQIEERFPNWRAFRDLIDCIDVTLHNLRSGYPS